MITAGLCFQAATSDTPDMVVYYGLPEEEGKIFITLFEKDYGVHIEGRAIKTGEMAEILAKEQKKPVASVVFGGSLPAYLSVKDKGLFAPYKPPQAKRFDKKFHDSGNFWTGIYVGIIGFCTSGTSDLKPPASWQDLLKPAYRGKIALSNPLTSGTAYITLATLTQLMGEEKAFKYMQTLDRQVSVYTRSGSEPCKLVSGGAAGVGISFVHDIIQIDRNKRKLLITFPAEGTGLEIGGAAITKNAPNMKLAQKFIDFLCSPKVQNMYGKGKIPPRFPSHPDVKPPAAAFTQGKAMKLIRFDFEWSGENEERLKKKWEELILLRRKK
ncbi:MAG: ABC transporter substrate-binding protein [bacterium]